VLFPDLSALLSLNQPLKPEVTSLARRPGYDGGTSTVNGHCSNGWKRRRYRRSHGRSVAAENRFDGSPPENGTLASERLFHKKAVPSQR